MSEAQNIYDDPVFFAGYERLRRTATGLNDVLEQPEPVESEASAGVPGLDLHRRRPPFLLLAADR